MLLSGTCSSALPLVMSRLGAEPPARRLAGRFTTRVARTEVAMKKTFAGIILFNLFLCGLLDVGVARGQAAAPAHAEATTLEPGRPVGRRINGGETHAFELNLTAGQFMHAEVEQSPGFDVSVSLSAPDGKQLVEMDGNYGFLWREAVSCVAQSGGAYRLHVKAYGPADSAGSYQIRVVELRPAAAGDAKRVAAEKVFAEGRRLYDQSPQPSPEAAERLQAAAAMWRETGDKFWEAVALTNLAWALTDLRKYDEAIAAHGRALPLFREIKDRVGEGKVVNGLGLIYNNAKDYPKARLYYEQALAVRRELKDRRGVGVTLANLGQVYQNLRDHEKAREYFEQSLLVARDVKNKDGEVFALTSLASVYKSLGMVDEVRECLEQALAIVKEIKDRRGERGLLKSLGLYYLQSLGHYEKAHTYFEQSLALSKALQDKAGEGDVLHNIGLNYLSGLNNCDQAREYFERALALKRELKDRGGESDVQGNLATAYLCLGQNEKVREHSEQALAIKEELKDRVGQISLLTGIGSGYMNSGRYEKARGYFEQALTIARAEKRSIYEVVVLGMLANLHSALHRYEKARELYEEALSVAKESRDKYATGILNGLAGVYVELKQYEKAADYYAQALSEARGFKDKAREVVALGDLSRFHVILRQFDKAQSYLEQALGLARGSGNKYSETSLLRNLGELHRKQNQYEKALGYHEQVLKNAREGNNAIQENFALLYLASTHADLSQYDRAREYFEQSLLMSRGTNRILECLALVSLGRAYFNLNQYEKSRAHYEQGLAIAKELKQRDIEGGATGNVGLIYADLRQNEKARSHYEQSLAMLKEMLNRRGEGLIRNALGGTYLNLKQYEKSREYYEQALAIAREVKEKDDEAHALLGLGAAHSDLNQLERARVFYDQGLALARAVRNRGAEGYALNGLGSLSQKLKQHGRAQDYHRQALTIAREIKSRKLEGNASWNLMNSFNEQGDPLPAVFYGKQAVNAFQSIRSDLKGFDTESQATFVKDKEQAYRTLANLLISEGRLAEARVVLDFLKEEEYGGVVRSVANPDTIPYGRAEADVIAKVDALASLARRRLELERRTSEELSAAETKELARLQSDMSEADVALGDALKTLQSSEPTASIKLAEMDGTNITNTLGDLSKAHDTGGVALYTVIGTEEAADGKGAAEPRRAKFGWVVLVTPTASKAYPIDVRELEETVFAFHTALSSDQYDPRPLAEKLYDKLFRQTSARQTKTLEADLNELLGGFGNRTIMWSLDGVLRYIPVAALHDGKQYLVEKYRNIIFTQQGLAGLNRADKKWRVLGLGVSEQRENFAALPGVKKELEDIVRQPGETTGILEGMRRLDGDFTKEESLLLWSRGEYTVVHIASHFSFDPLDQRASFLLLGDGRLTFAEMWGRRGLFNAVDLLALSACDTAMSGNGKESEGFAFLAQRLGATTVLASLWKVSDEGTPELMARFYKLRAENPQVPKGEAFRQAQLSLLGPEAVTDEGGRPAARRAELAVADGLKGKLPRYVRDARRPFAHPYYWSSFVFIGNWR
jgi:CHAT domain-containing protein/tetratricopeptide (TPR) repeat protein